MRWKSIYASDAEARGKSVAELTLELCNEAATLPAGKNMQSNEYILASYICEMTRFLSNQPSGIEVRLKSLFHLPQF